MAASDVDKGQGHVASVAAVGVSPVGVTRLRLWFNQGLVVGVLVWGWFGVGVGLVWVWCGFGLGLVWVWCGLGGTVLEGVLGAFGWHCFWGLEGGIGEIGGLPKEQLDDQIVVRGNLPRSSSMMSSSRKNMNTR